MKARTIVIHCLVPAADDGSYELEPRVIRLPLSREDRAELLQRLGYRAPPPGDDPVSPPA